MGDECMEEDEVGFWLLDLYLRMGRTGYEVLAWLKAQASM